MTCPDGTSAEIGTPTPGGNDSDGSNSDTDGVPDTDAGPADSDVADTDGPDDIVVDADNDGYGSASDCDDFDPTVNPGATEVCGGRDDDCDGLTDDDDPGLDVTSASTWWLDQDGDGARSGTSRVLACAQPAGTLSSQARVDCDDSNAAVYPFAFDPGCDGVDTSCRGTPNEIFVPDDAPSIGAALQAAGFNPVTVCLRPGTWAATNLVLSDVDLVGVGATPEDVVLTTTSSSSDPVLVAGSTRVQNLTLRSRMELSPVNVDGRIALSDLVFDGDLAGLSSDPFVARPSGLDVTLERITVHDAWLWLRSNIPVTLARSLLNLGREIRIESCARAEDIVVRGVAADPGARRDALIELLGGGEYDHLLLEDADAAPTAAADGLVHIEGHARHVEVRGVTVTQTAGTGRFGGIVRLDDGGSIENLLIAGATVTWDGGALDGVGLVASLDSTVAVPIRNVTIAGIRYDGPRRASALGVGVAVAASTSARVVDVIVFDVRFADGTAIASTYAASGSVEPRWDDVFPGGLVSSLPGTAHLAADPSFVEYDHANEPSTWDLHLSAASPLLDAGDPAVLDPLGLRQLGAFGGPQGGDW